MNQYVERALVRAHEMLRSGPALRARATEAAGRWEWWTCEAKLDRPEPLARERLGGPKRVAKREEPRSGESADGYGYDGQQRVVWGKTVMAGAPKTFHRFFEYGHDGVGIASYLDEQLDMGEFALLVDGRVKAFARVPLNGGAWTELYEYDDNDRLLRVTGRVDYPSLGAAYDFETNVTHDAAGRLSEIVETTSSGFRDVLYRTKKPAKGAVLADLARIQAGAIFAAAQMAPPAEQVYALLLRYDEEDAIPPTVVWAPERHRRAVLAETPVGVHRLWNPLEVGRLETVADQDALRAGEPGIAVLAADLQDLDPDGGLARQALHRTCRDLNERDWSAYPVTEDFVVLCVDPHLEHFTEDFKASVPDRKLRERIMRMTS